MDEAIGMVDRSVSELQNLMMNIRMIPLNHIFNRLPRVVRDVAQHDGKEVEFVIDGGETELDRSVMDGLNDPLLHLIRNAVNHGIESPETRKKAGKPQKGYVTLSAHRDQDNVIIELIDDGAGINVNKVKAKAIEKGLVTMEAAETFTTDQAIELLFLPGFSTADKISDISGRGVGLDVVQRSIEALKGTIRVETTPGKGSRFELVTPAHHGNRRRDDCQDQRETIWYPDKQYCGSGKFPAGCHPSYREGRGDPAPGRGTPDSPAG